MGQTADQILSASEYGVTQMFSETENLLKIGSGSLKAGEKSSMWCIGKTLKAMSNVLTDTPARRDMFQKVTGSNQFPLPYCGHRWYENENQVYKVSAKTHKKAAATTR